MTAAMEPLETTEQHKRRMSRMPWLYLHAPETIAAWARPWQTQIHRRLAALEDLDLDPSCFVAPEADLIAEPGRRITIGARSAVAIHAFVHGPVTIGDDVTVNASATLDGGAGITVGSGTRIATGARLFGFNHRIAPTEPIFRQRVRARGIVVGEDAWIGANAGITDGVCIGDHAVVAMGAVVTSDVSPWAVVAGVPAKPIGDRRDPRWATR